MSNVTDFVLDWETMGNAPEGAVVDLAVLVFEHDPHNLPTFEELCRRGRRFKFDLKSQKGKRIFDQGTMDWWKKQSDEAKLNLKPSDIDVDYLSFYDDFMNFLKAEGFNKKTGQGWCRGQSFDFPILIDVIRQIHGTRETFNLEPCFFWQQRDVRTAVEATLMVRDMTMCPMPKGALDGFVMHDAIHDCAKAALELLYSKRYALGLEEVPTGNDIDPRSVRK
ncbi:exonuclease A [Aeromonas phage Riv-10]|nr:exonuclease A [Aeromonas phage Riv-10]